MSDTTILKVGAQSTIVKAGECTEVSVKQGPTVLQTCQGLPGSPGQGVTEAELETDDDVVVGQPVYIKTTNGHFGLARANSLVTSRMFGLSLEDESAGFAPRAASIGPVTRADWTPVTGAATLSAGAQYYLDDSAPGMLTTTPPAIAGTYVTRVGIAINTTTLDIHIHRPIGKV